MLANVIALALSTAVLAAIPGPNVALIVANSIRHGSRSGVITVLGTTLGVALQLALVLGGFVALVGAAADALAWIKWAGAAYLIFLGVKTWNEPVVDLAGVEGTEQPLFWRGAMLAVVNPKTLTFNAAFLPQFVDRSSDVAAQMPILAAIFLIVLSLGDCLWALAAVSARSLLMNHGRLRNRITGGFLTASGVGLALARR